MDFWEVIKKRKCTRSFSEKPVSDDLIEKIVMAGKRAPSAGGIYPVDFIVVKNKDKKEALVQSTFSGQSFIAEAPVVIAIVVDMEKTASKYEDRGRRLYAIQDGAAATENMFLAITALGLETCWVGAFDENEVKNILNLDKNIRPQALLPIGYGG